MKNYEFMHKALFRLEDIKKEFNTEQNMYATIKRLVSDGRIRKLKGGLYALVDPLSGDIYVNRQEIATSLYKNSYVAFHTALEFYGLHTQMYSDVQVIAQKRNKPIEIDGLEYICYLSNYNDGVINAKKHSNIRVTELERTIVDCVYRSDIVGGLEEIYYALKSVKNCDEKKILNHLKGYGIKLLYKKIGFLFSLINPDYISKDFFNECKKNMSNKRDDIRENKYAPWEYSKEWKVYAPKYIINDIF